MALWHGQLKGLGSTGDSSAIATIKALIDAELAIADVRIKRIELFFGLEGMQVKKEWELIAEGTPVEFQIGQNKKGACAVNVRIRKMIPGISQTTHAN